MIARLLPAIALAAACNGGATMRVRLDVDACDEEASQITLPCEGVIGVWLVDAQDNVLEESCIPLRRGTPLFVLDDILRDQVAFGGRTPGEIVAIELGVFEGKVSDPPVCVRDAASSFVYGRSDDFEVGAVTDVDLILTCFDTSNECDPAFVVSATLTDFTDGGGGPVASGKLSAGVVDDAVGVPSFVVLTELVADGGGQFSGQLGATPDGACFASVLDDESPLLPLLSCDSTVNESTREGFIEAYSVDPDLRSTAEQEIGLGAGVLGRVVDAMGMPVGNARVDAGGAFVAYFNEAMNSTGGSETTSNGLFIVHGPGSDCCRTITATGPEPGGTRGSRRTGFVIDHLVTTVIRLEPVNQ